MTERLSTSFPEAQVSRINTCLRAGIFLIQSVSSLLEMASLTRTAGSSSCPLAAITHGAASDGRSAYRLSCITEIPPVALGAGLAIRVDGPHMPTPRPGTDKAEAVGSPPNLRLRLEGPSNIRAPRIGLTALITVDFHRIADRTVDRRPLQRRFPGIATEAGTIARHNHRWFCPEELDLWRHGDMSHQRNRTYGNLLADTLSLAITSDERVAGSSARLHLPRSAYRDSAHTGDPHRSGVARLPLQGGRPALGQTRRVYLKVDDHRSRRDAHWTHASGIRRHTTYHKNTQHGILRRYVTQPACRSFHVVFS